MEEALRLAQLQLRQAEVRAEVWESQATAGTASKGAAADDANGTGRVGRANGLDTTAAVAPENEPSNGEGVVKVGGEEDGDNASEHTIASEVHQLVRWRMRAEEAVSVGRAPWLWHGHDSCFDS